MVDLAEIQAAYYMVAATGVLVAAAYYVMNLRITQRNQELTLKALEQSAKAQQQTLESRQAQMFMNIYDQTKSNEFTTAYNKVVNDTKWSTIEEYQAHWVNDPEFKQMTNTLGIFFEGIGVLVKEGMLDIRWIALLICGMTRSYWEKYQPIIEDGRRLWGYRRWWSESEYLYNELIRYVKEHPELETRIGDSSSSPFLGHRPVTQ
jgi:hypothetical protein